MMLLCVVFSANGDSKSFQNVDACLPNCRASHARCCVSVVLEVIYVYNLVLSHPLESVCFWLTKDVLVTIVRASSLSSSFHFSVSTLVNLRDGTRLKSRRDATWKQTASPSQALCCLKNVI
jgi:hypothetical protein